MPPFFVFFFKKQYTFAMKTVGKKKIITAAKECIYEANFYLPEKIQQTLQKISEEETAETAKETLQRIRKNANIAPQKKLPLCQDTGTAVFLVEMGHNVQLEEPIEKTLNHAVAEGYEEYFLRKSIITDPLFERKNTGNNCPAIVHIHQTTGDKLRISFLPKGGGAENKSIVQMLRPADGKQGVVQTVLNAAKNAGGSSCPPWIVGVGIGGNFDSVGLLAKKAIVREVGTKNLHPKYENLEKELTKKINKLHIGAMGFGGEKTVLAVHIEYAPTHIASLPVAVNFQCHSARSATRIL